MSMSLIPGKGSSTPAQPVDEEVAAQQRAGAQRPEMHPAEGQGDERDDDEGVEDDGAQDGALGGGQPHDVQRSDHREGADQHGREDGEILGHVVGDAEGGERPPRHEHLLADLHDLDELGGVGVQVHHVPRLLGGLGPRVHRHPHVGLGQGGGVVGAVPRHGHQIPGRLLLPDERQLVLGRRLRQEVVHPRLAGDRRGREGVVPGDHHRPDPHRPEPLEPVAQAPLDDVLQVHRPEDPGAVRHDQGGPALEGDAGDRVLHLRGEPAPGEGPDGVRRPLADLPPVHVHAAHPRLRREGDETGVGHLREVPPPEAELFRQDDDAAALRRLVGQRGKLGGVRQLLDASPPSPGGTPSPAGRPA